MGLLGCLFWLQWSGLLIGFAFYKGFPTSASNSHPGSIAQQLTQERMFRFSLQAKFVAGAAGY